MENASKALLIAAGIFIGIIAVSLIMLGYRNISDYYNAKEDAKEFEQMGAFNKQYVAYNRDDVRGSDLLSLINKILDFNRIQNEELINIEITIPNIDEARMFYFSGTLNSEKIISIGYKYTHRNIDTKLLVHANNIENKYTQALAVKLSANVSTLMGGNSLKTPQDLLEEYNIDPSDYGGIGQIESDILKYYQYQQFKRAHFSCEKLSYNGNGRVESLEFKFTGKFE